MQSLHLSLLLQLPPVEAMVHAAGLSIVDWVVLSERYHVHTRSDEECDHLLHPYQLDRVHRGYIGGMLLEKFYNRGWVDYVLLALTPHRAARLDAATRCLSVCFRFPAPERRGPLLAQLMKAAVMRLSGPSQFDP
jgi:hypothetical protein